jgi:hypothetical protein
MRQWGDAFLRRLLLSVYVGAMVIALVGLVYR